MEDAFPRALRLEIAFPDWVKAKHALEELFQPSGSGSHLLRGRLAKKGAWLEVEVREDSGALDDLLTLGRACGGSVRRGS